jgi:heptosyltransferase-1
MSYQKILIVKLSAIGDVIHALPVAYALKQAFPQARLTWVVESSVH